MVRKIKWCAGLLTLVGGLVGPLLSEAAPPLPQPRVPAVPPAPRAPIRRLDSALQGSLVSWGEQRQGQSIAPPGLKFTCANFVHVALHSVGAKSTSDFGVLDPPAPPGGWPNDISPTDYVWGNLKFTYRPGVDAVSALDAIQVGYVLQFREVRTPYPVPDPVIHQHTAIVDQNMTGGQMVFLQQNWAQVKHVTLNQVDMSRWTGGTVWVYEPVPLQGPARRPQVRRP
jgi:hypothetical protein